MSITVDTSPTKPFNIRNARASDADAVFELLTQLAESYLPLRHEFDLTFATLVAGVAESRNADSVIVVAEDSNGVVRGYALTTISRLLHTNGFSAQLQELVVDEAARGTGIGSALVEATERVCRERGAKQLTVASRRSAGFYERLLYRSTADFLKRTLD